MTKPGSALDFLNDTIGDRLAQMEEAEKLIRQKMSVSVEQVDFPVDAFPPLLRDMINAYCKCYGSEPAHYGLTIMTVAGACIGNSVWVKERNGRQPALLYGAVVDLPGRGKTPIIETFLKPIYRIEQEYREQHAEKLRAYKEAQIKGDQDHINPPIGREFVLNNFTIESVYSVLNNNPRGAIVFKDELAGWIRSMDAYKAKGSEEQTWLEIYNGGMLKINRKSALRAMFIENAFCSVIGGTQPGIIEEFGQGSKGLNGFLARILFAYPDEMESTTYSRNTPSPNYAKAWDNMVDVLMDLPMRYEQPEDEFGDWKIKPIYLRLSEKAVNLYIKFFDSISEKENDCMDDEIKRSMITKHKSHCLRLALILHFLDYAEAVHNHCPDYRAADWTDQIRITSEDVEEMKISGDVMARAIRLDQYFLHTSLKVVGKLGSPVDRLKPNVMAWYQELPSDRIHRDEAIKLGKVAKISSRTVGRYLSNEKGKLFKKVASGYYEKVYEV